MSASTMGGRVGVQQPEGSAASTDRWWDSYAARASAMLASEVRALFAVASQPEIVSLTGGMPTVDALCETLGCPAAEGARVKLLYTVPTFQNPGGITLSAPQRAEIVEACARAGVLVVHGRGDGDGG